MLPCAASGDSSSDWFVYIVKCSDGTFYTGVSKDVSRRVDDHNSERRGAKYTRPRRPVSLHHSEGPMTRPDALRREMEIKGLRRSQKEGIGDR